MKRESSQAASKSLRRTAGKRFHFDALGVLRVLVVVFFSVFLIGPIIAMVLTGLTNDLVNIYGSLISWEELQWNLDIIRTSASFEYIRKLFSNSRYVQATINSLVLSAGVALSSVVLTMPIAYGIARTNMAGKRLIGTLLLVPLIVPTFIAGHGFLLMFDRTGWVSQLASQIFGIQQLIDLRSGLAIFWVQLFTFFPFALLPMIAAFKIADAALEEASESLGAPKWLTWLTVTLPLAFPGIAAAALLVFVVTLSDFGAPIILAPKGFPLLPVEAYREMSGYFNWSGAAILSLVLVIVAGLMLAMQKFVLRGGNYGLQVKEGRPLVGGRRLTLPLQIYSVLFLLMPLALIASVVLQSFATTWGLRILPDGYTLANYAHVLERSADKIRNSLLLGVGALLVSTVVATTTAFFAVRRKGQTLDFIATMPLAIPGVALGIAFIQTFNLPPFEFVGTAFLLVIAYAIRRLPHMLRTTSAAITQVKQDVEEAAVSLGASPLLMIMTVVFPLVIPGIVAGAIIVFVTVIKEISITVLLAPAQWAPMSLEVFRLLLRGEVYIASALAIVIVLIVTAFQLIAQRIAGDKALF